MGGQKIKKEVFMAACSKPSLLSLPVPMFPATMLACYQGLLNSSTWDEILTRFISIVELFSVNSMSSRQPTANQSGHIVDQRWNSWILKKIKTLPPANYKNIDKPLKEAVHIA